MCEQPLKKVNYKMKYKKDCELCNIPISNFIYEDDEFTIFYSNIYSNLNPPIIVFRYHYQLNDKQYIRAQEICNKLFGNKYEWAEDKSKFNSHWFRIILLNKVND